MKHIIFLFFFFLISFNSFSQSVYSTDYNRTKLTAKPTADSKNLPLLLYHPNDMYSESFQHETKGRSILVVGHSNTINVFANKVLGIEKYNQISDDNNSNLYIVTVIDEKVSSTLLKFLSILRIAS